MADDQHTATLPLPADAWHRAQGARMVPFAGYAMPIQYEGIVAEHLWTRENAGLFDVSHMGQLLITGAGAAEALEAILPSNIKEIGRDRVRYSLLLAEDGGILDDLMVTNRPDGLFVIVNGACKHDDIAYLREHLPDEVTINHIEDRALFAVQGPKAVDALRRLIPGCEAMFFMEASRFSWGDQLLEVSRSGYTGEDGFEVSVPVDYAESFAEVLCSLPEVKPVGLGARDSLRLEAGLPLYGHDLNDTVDPVEGNASFAIQKRRREEGGFPGADRILKALRDGPARKLAGFTVAGKMPVREGAPLFAGERQVGTVTSGGFSPSLDHPIGMALIDAAYSASGAVLDAEVRGRRVPVTTAAMPFVPHRYHRRGVA
ncbi:glycine cleavage system aminomethyltransferase GcvT [Sphingomonas sp. SUN039]|uniref:glycine cleavage system aminomethyltransferase GcvT n=1 Tax=Sphingomonas sp. SUN039 TaxID=2937787 RepID=UPI0021642058|nr:glycine cleavage system aminomethyltransferase GcvT [Sphingomonas sp. SUN039]UVO53359.1 glycine cleavage system aminomethyltransferase GcvT [Sphingomonas sp. SUN039]